MNKAGWTVVAGAMLIAMPAAADANFQERELALELFGFHGSRDKDGDNDDAWGPGLGLSYYLNRNLGVAVDTYTDGLRDPYLLNASAIYRYPIRDTSFAPYGLGGVGRQWDHVAQWTAHIGAGFEYRFREHAGLFAEVREVFPDDTGEYTAFRFGVRWQFR